MAGVYCPTCEAGVEAAAKFCLSCGHDMTGQGPITATGHDLNQLKDVIRIRDDLSMAEKFDMIAKVEEGANPILMGIAAPAEGDEIDLALAEENENSSSKSFSNYEWGKSPAANAAVMAVVRDTTGWDLIQSGRLDLKEGMFREAMDNGMEASTHIHDVASGEHEGIDPDAMRAIPVLKPPKRSFCPKCGSDIHANTMLQWRKWRESSNDVVSMQLEASMETALIQVASHYLGTLQILTDERDDAIALSGKNNPAAIEEKLRVKLEKDIRKELEKEIRSEMEQEFSGRGAASSSKSATKGASAGKSSGKSSGTSTTKKPTSGGTKKKTGGGMFGSKTPKKTYEGKAAGKADWFLSDALDTVYDPHGTGKVMKPATIVARSSEGNVRVRDVVRIYAVEGEAGISELAWTSPLTKYIIEAYDAC